MPYNFLEEFQRIFYTETWLSSSFFNDFARLYVVTPKAEIIRPIDLPGLYIFGKQYNFVILLELYKCVISTFINCLKTSFTSEISIDNGFSDKGRHK